MKLKRIEVIESNPHDDTVETEREMLRLAQIANSHSALENSGSDWAKKFWKNNLTILLRRTS